MGIPFKIPVYEDHLSGMQKDNDMGGESLEAVLLGAV